MRSSCLSCATRAFTCLGITVLLRLSHFPLYILSPLRNAALGVMTPSSFNRARLCAIYGMTTEELGLEEEVIRLTDLPAFTGDLQVFLNADFTMRLLALVF